MFGCRGPKTKTECRDEDAPKRSKKSHENMPIRSSTSGLLLPLLEPLLSYQIALFAAQAARMRQIAIGKAENATLKGSGCELPK